MAYDKDRNAGLKIHFQAEDERAENVAKATNKRRSKKAKKDHQVDELIAYSQLNSASKARHNHARPPKQKPKDLGKYEVGEVEKVGTKRVFKMKVKVA